MCQGGGHCSGQAPRVNPEKQRGSCLLARACATSVRRLIWRLALIIVSNLFALLLYVIWLFNIAIILSAVVSMLISFGVLDTRNRFVWQVSDFLYRVTEPAIRPLRAVLPSFSGIDFSPWAAILLIRYVVVPVVQQIGAAVGVPFTYLI